MPVEEGIFERCRALVVYRTRIRALSEQQAHDILVAFACRTVERRPASALSRFASAPAASRRFATGKRPWPAARCSGVNPPIRRESIVAPDLKEQLHDFVMPVLCCDVECRGGFSIACVDLGPRRKQQPDEQVMALPRRNVQY